MNMKRILLYILICLLPTLALNAKDQGRNQQRGTSKILFIHLQDTTDFREYKEFDRDFKAELIMQGVRPDVKDLYLGMKNPEFGAVSLRNGLNSISNWKPQLIIVERDRALERLASLPEGVKLISSDIPVLAVGLEFHDRFDFETFRNVKPIWDEPDFATNIDVACSFSGKRIIAVELEDNSFDEELLTLLRATISKQKYLDITGKLLPSDYVSDIDKITVTSLPLRDVETIHRVYPTLTNDRLDGYYMEYAARVASRSAGLSIKTDLYSDALCNLYGRPQFTTRREAFYGHPDRYLAGYFASYETIARDAAREAAKILKGKPSSGILRHEKALYVNWASMAAYGLKSKDIDKKFTIVGQPFLVQYRSQTLLYSSIILLILALAWTFGWAIRKRLGYEKERAASKQKAIVEASLSSMNGILTSSRDELLTFCQKIHPDNEDDLRYIMEVGENDEEEYEEQDGKLLFCRRARRVQLSFNNGRSYKTWYAISGRARDASGVSTDLFIMLDINDVREREIKLEKARTLVSQAEQKEKFLIDISHQMRTPMNAILGFSEIMSMDDSLSPEERKEICGYINENSDMLYSIIDNILQYSRYESGRVQAVMEEVQLDSFFEGVLNQWKDNESCPYEIVFRPGRSKVCIQADKFRLAECFKQLVSNAIKYAESPTITIGWNYHFASSRVSMWVEDEGVGFPKNLEEHYTDPFWRANSFSMGAGLGLSLVNAYAKIMNADFSLDTCQGVGSRLSLEFPAYLQKNAE